MVYEQNMMIVDLVNKISEGDPGALEVCAVMIMDPRPTAFMHLLAFGDHNIKGGEIWKLYNDCCKQNLDLLCATMRMLQFGMISDEEVKTNLSRKSPLAFIEDVSAIKGYLSDRDDITDMSQFKVSLSRLVENYRLKDQSYSESQLGGNN